MRVSLRRTSTVAVFGALLTATFVGCLPNPEKDFDDYGKRAEPFNQPPPDAGEPIDAKAPEEAVEGLYYTACLTQLTPGNAGRVFNFYTSTKFVPAEGGGGTLTLTLQPIAVDTFGVPPETFSKNDTIGAAYTSLPSDGPNVAADGNFELAFGDVEVSGDANPVTGRDILIEQTMLGGRFSTERSCARLSGTLVKPTTITLEGSKNTCLMLPIEEGDPIPRFEYEQDFKQGCQ